MLSIQPCGPKLMVIGISNSTNAISVLLLIISALDSVLSLQEAYEYELRSFYHYHSFRVLVLLGDLLSKPEWL
jgi:S-adenosylmethionine:tRNA-ribosyltransferase-isomerase (queuine synthetase)